MLDIKTTLSELSLNEKLMEKANNCKSMEELYGVMSSHIKDVSYNEFCQSVLSLEETSMLDDVDLEYVTGGSTKCFKIGGSLTVTINAYDPELETNNSNNYLN